MTNATDKALALTPQEFAHLGDGAVAYVKTHQFGRRCASLSAGASAPARRQAVRAARRRRLADPADRLQGRRDRQRLGERASRPSACTDVEKPRAGVVRRGGIR